MFRKVSFLDVAPRHRLEPGWGPDSLVAGSGYPFDILLTNARHSLRCCHAKDIYFPCNETLSLLLRFSLSHSFISLPLPCNHTSLFPPTFCPIPSPFSLPNPSTQPAVSPPPPPRALYKTKHSDPLILIAVRTIVATQLVDLLLQRLLTCSQHYSGYSPVKPLLQNKEATWPSQTIHDSI